MYSRAGACMVSYAITLLLHETHYMYSIIMYVGLHALPSSWATTPHTLQMNAEESTCTSLTPKPTCMEVVMDKMYVCSLERLAAL